MNPLDPVPGRPGMHAQPSQIPPEKAKEMPICFITADRMCGPDCMAFITAPSQDPDYRGQHFARCHLLMNLHRVGKHVVIVAKELTKLTRGPDPAAQHANIPPPEVK